MRMDEERDGNTTALGEGLAVPCRKTLDCDALLAQKRVKREDEGEVGQG
jgi:hypothetical protein